MRRWPTIPFRRLLGYSLVLVAPTVLVLDVLVYLGILVVDQAIWVVATVMVSTIGIVWLLLGELAGIAHYTDRIAAGDDSDMAQLNTEATRGIVRQVARLDGKWRQQVRAFSQSIDADMQILESLIDPLILVNSDYRVVRANIAATKLFGRSLADEAIETALQPPELIEAVHTALETRQTQSFEFEWRGPFTRFFDARVMPIATPHDQAEAVQREAGLPPAIAAVITLYETTEMHRAAEVRETFIANVSHELRTPLSVVIGFVETLQTMALGTGRADDMDVQKKFLGIMHDQATRMARLVTDLLSLSRLDAQDHAPTEIVNLAEIIHDIYSVMELQAAGRTIRIEQDVEVQLPLHGDYDQLCQIVQNLLDNAVNYGRAGGKVTISAKRAEAQIVVCVADDGEGIAAEHIPRLGERFYRVDPARSRETGGSGLGLAIVQGIVRRHDGTLLIESTPGAGSVFTIIFPAAA